MEPASGESCPPGRRRRPAAPGEDTVLSPDEKSLHTPTTPTTQGRKQRSPESIPPLTVLKTQPHWLIADWLGLMEPARGESSPSGQRRSPAAPGEDKFPSLDQNLSLSLQLQQTGDENADPRGQYRPSRCGNLNTTGWLLIGWGSWSQHAARASPRDNIEVPPHPGRTQFIPGLETLPCLYNFNNPAMKTQIPRVDTAPHGVGTPTTLAGC